MQKINKKHVIAALAVILVLAVAIGATMAYLTDSQKVTNVFTVGDLDIALEEPDYPYKDDPAPPDATPGTSYKKNPTLYADKGDSYARFIVEFIDLDTNLVITNAARVAKIWQTIYYTNNTLAVNNESDDGTAPIYRYTLNYVDSTGAPSITANGTLDALKHFNDTAFTKDTGRSSVGKEYYNYTANGGIFLEGTQAVLFDRFVVPVNWNQYDMAILGKYKIVITAQAIQKQNFVNSTDAFAALDVEVQDNSLLVTYKDTTLP
jgi:predicted ribosomally synthesized peptide with SipW-like signal peptide